MGGDFKIKDLFKVYTGRDVILNQLEDGDIPVITHSVVNNGIQAFTKRIDDRRLFNGNTTISLADRGNFKAHVQNSDFHIGTRVKALELKKIDKASKESLLFLSIAINNQSDRFSYGFNATNRIDDMRIILPIDKNGEPNWLYMENFIKHIEQKKLKEVVEYLRQYIYIYI